MPAMILSTESKYPSRGTCDGAVVPGRHTAEEGPNAQVWPTSRAQSSARSTDRHHPTNPHITPCARARRRGEQRDARSSARPRGTKATLCRNDRLLSGSHLVACRLGLALHGTLLLIHTWFFNP